MSRWDFDLEVKADDEIVVTMPFTNYTVKPDNSPQLLARMIGARQ